MHAPLSVTQYVFINFNFKFLFDFWLKINEVKFMSTVENVHVKYIKRIKYSIYIHISMCLEC